MKKVLKVLSFIMIMILLTACKEEAKEMKNTTTADSDTVGVVDEIKAAEIGFKYNSDMRYAERYQMVSLSEAGVIYDDHDGGLVHLVTIDEADDMVLCYNPNCTHPKARATYGDPECMGAMYDSILCRTAYYNGSVYFFVGDGVFAHRVYVMDTNGSGRKLLAEFPFFFSISYFAIFKDDKVYYTAQIPNVDEITNKVSYMNRIIELNLRDGSYRFITEESEDLMSWANLSENTFYVRPADQSDGGRLYLQTININTLETKIAISTDEWKAGIRYVDAYDGDSYYYYDKMTYELGIRNVDGTVEEILLKGAEGEDYVCADPSCDGLFYKREYDYEDEPAGGYFLDMKTREVINITDEMEKYNIMGYDGYYGAFVGRDADFNWSMWSKEKVLGEAKADS